jgi:transposase InsO family protein
MIVAWRIEPTETGELAAQMFISAVGDHQGRPALVHSDGGTAMTSQSLTALFKNLGIEVSKNRPRVSNDNPHAEALFKTAKYGPGVPVFFDTIEQARAWAETFVEYYNHDHRHSSLEGHTPASVHDGSWGQVHKDRQATLDKLAGQHPERYRKPITVKAPYAHVTLNTPSDQKTEDRLKTG